MSGRVARVLRRGEAGDARGASGRRIAGIAGLQLVGRVLQMAISLITLPLIARSLGTSDFGVWTSAFAYVGVFSSFTEFGLAFAATMKMASEPEEEARWLGAMSSLRTVNALVLATVCALGVPLFLGGEGNGEIRTVALVLSVSIVFTGAQSLMAVFQSRLRGEIPLLVQAAQALLWLIAVVTVTATGASPLKVALGWLVVLAIMASVQVRLTRDLVQVAWRGVVERWRALLRIAVPIGLAGVFVTIYYKIDAVLLYRLADSEEAGLYGAAARLLDAVVVLPAAIMTAFLPAMSADVVEDRPRVRSMVQTGANLMGVLSFPAVAVGFVLGGPVIELLFGDGFDRSAEVLPVLMIAFVIICFGNLAGYLAPVVGLQWRITIYAAAGAVANVVLNVILIPEYGALGSAWATVGTEGLTMLLMAFTAGRRIGFRPQGGVLARTLLAAGVMALAMLAARPLGAIPGLVAGGAVYAAALVALRAVRPAELRALRRGAA